MLTALVVILSIVLVGWLIWRAIKGKPIRVHLVMNLLSALTSIYTIAFFMTMDISLLADGNFGIS